MWGLTPPENTVVSLSPSGRSTRAIVAVLVPSSVIRYGPWKGHTSFWASFVFSTGLYRNTLSPGRVPPQLSSCHSASSDAVELVPHTSGPIPTSRHFGTDPYSWRFTTVCVCRGLSVSGTGSLGSRPYSR